TKTSAKSPSTVTKEGFPVAAQYSAAGEPAPRSGIAARSRLTIANGAAATVHNAPAHDAQPRRPGSPLAFPLTLRTARPAAAGPEVPGPVAGRPPRQARSASPRLAPRPSPAQPPSSSRSPCG